MEVCCDSNSHIFYSDSFIGRCTRGDFAPIGLLCHCTHKEKDESKASYSLKKNSDILRRDDDIERGVDYPFATHRFHSTHY
jgi:hypothetical protein